MRNALRSLVRSPEFTVFAVLALALIMGACTAVLSVCYATAKLSPA